MQLAGLALTACGLGAAIAGGAFVNHPSPLPSQPGSADVVESAGRSFGKQRRGAQRRTGSEAEAAAAVQQGNVGLLQQLRSDPQAKALASAAASMIPVALTLLLVFRY